MSVLANIQTIDGCVASINIIKTFKHLQSRSFSCTIGAQQTIYLTCFDAKTDPIDRIKELILLLRMRVSFNKGLS